MTAIMVLAAAAAAGLVRLYRLAVPAAPDLLGQTARWDQARARAGRRAALSQDTTGGLLARAARWLADQLRVRRGDDLQSVERDLAISGTTLEAWMTKTLGVTLAGLLAPFAILTVLRAAGLGVPLSWAPLAGIPLGALMIALSVSDLRTQARSQREDFRRALSIYLDLVVMSMEAGRGHAEAIPAAAGIGTGWAFVELQDAVHGARVAGITPWEALGRLGERYGISELIELRSTLALAHDEGGRIRSTLIARSETMREARLADAQARANKATDAMRNNLILMAIVGVAYVIVPRLLFLMTSG